MEDSKKDKDLVEKSNLSTNVEPFVPRNFTKTVDVISYDQPNYPAPIYTTPYYSDSYGGAGYPPPPYYGPPMYPAAAAIYPAPTDFYQPSSPHPTKHNKSHTPVAEEERRDSKDKRQNSPREFGGRGRFDGARGSRRIESHQRRLKLNSLVDFPSLPNSEIAPSPRHAASLYSSKVKAESPVHKPSPCPNNAPLKELNANKAKKKELRQNMCVAAPPPSNNEVRPKPGRPQSERIIPHHHSWESRIFFKENREAHDKNIYRDDLPEEKTNCKAFHTNLDHSHKFCQKTERLKNEANSRQSPSISLKYKNNLDAKLPSNNNSLAPSRGLPQREWQSPSGGNLSFINTRLSKKPFKNQANLKNFITSPKKCFKETFKNSLEPDDPLEKLNIKPPSDLASLNLPDTEEYPELGKPLALKIPRAKPSHTNNRDAASCQESGEVPPSASSAAAQKLELRSCRTPAPSPGEPLVASPEKPKDGKSRNPLELDFTNLLKIAAPKAQQKKKKEPRVLTKKQAVIIRPANILDSSAPITKKGKERLVPRPKRPSHLKKIIILEKEEKKKLREQILKTELEKGGGEKKQAESDGAQPLDEPDNHPLSPNQSEDPIQSESPDPCDQSEDPIQSESPDPCDQSEDPIQSESPGPCGEVPSPDLAQAVDQPAQAETIKTRRDAARVIVHTRKFREYCTHLPSAELDATVQCLLALLLRFQDRAQQRDPIKAKSKRRVVYGLREITKHLKLHKIRAIVFATDIEKIDSQGGLMESLAFIQELAAQQNVHCIYALRRSSLGRACFKKVSISCIGIFNFEGADKQYRHMVELAEQLTQAYVELLSMVESQLPEDALSQLQDLDPLSPHFHRWLFRLRRRILPDRDHQPSPPPEQQQPE